MKRCGRCGVEKPLDEFHRWNQRDGPQFLCKPCRKEYDRDYHARNRERLVALAKKRQQRFLEWHRQLKSTTPCADCGGYFHFAVMAWDHLPGTHKVAEVSTLLRKGSSRKVREEIDKCELVCANCHALRSYSRIGA
jgi:hypothetical protein